ncbi:MAG: glycosyltransferase family 4 protein [Cyanobacteria bacterium REEB67]|nr:glycosyltransferase family 4 protein [Cyanobacteria bacterium REEB67]
MTLPTVTAENKKLRIAMVLRLFSRSGGLELYALKLVEGLLEDGHSVCVICETNESGLEHPLLKVHSFKDKLSGAKSKSDKLHHYFRAASEAVAALGPFDIVHSQHFPVSPVDVVTFHNHTTRRLSQVGYGWEKLLNEVKLALTDAYKTREYYDGKLTREAKLRIFVGEVMRDDYYNTFNMPEEALYAIAHPGASLGEPPLAAQGRSNEAAKTDLKAAREQANDQANEQANEQAEELAEEQAKERPFTFLFVGKGFRKKGLDTLLKSCQILKKRGHKFVLQIAGIKERPVRKLELIAAGLTDCVHYLGFRQDMEAVYAGADASILPSKIEPFGMAPIQGMQYGLVPIVSSVCGVAEVLSDGENALILRDHLDSGALADLMQLLLLDRELYKRLQEQARPTANRLNWRKTIDATEQAYEKIRPHVNNKEVISD